MTNTLRFLLASFCITALNFIPAQTTAQCLDSEEELHLLILTDNWPYETSWAIETLDGMTIAEGEEGIDETFCIPAGQCIAVNVYDSYGDGIYTSQGGGVWISLNGQLVDSILGDWGSFAASYLNCADGTVCNSPLTAELGTNTVLGSAQWFEFQAAETGLYTISTCDLANCDTRIAVYEYCNMANFDDTQVGTIYFDDNEGGCGEEAEVSLSIAEGVTYLIRVFPDAGTANCNEEFSFEISYDGPIVGCTDITACNYNPLATVSDDSCIYPGDPDCDEGPDLVVLSDVLQNSISTQTLFVASSDCYIEEECLNGYGSRELIRFTTHIKNIGSQDYYIGNPNTNPDQFTYGNCHNHWHYDGYAEYLLFDASGNPTPIGRKNGFCVMDLECSDGGNAQYGCSDMGISAQCGDIYGSGLACQWVDVTSIPDGTYTLVVRVNWDQSPDALGRQELDYDNNWAQACIEINRDSGQLEVILQEDCEPYTDCAGEVFGSATVDCLGNCGGDALIGDLNQSGNYDLDDGKWYVSGILRDTLEVTSCNDLDGNGILNVTDVSFFHRCNDGTGVGQNPDCNFPRPVVSNPFDTATFRIAAHNLAESWFDVQVKVPYEDLRGYQLRLSGLTIDTIIEIAPEDYQHEMKFSYSQRRLMGFSRADSSLERSDEWQDLVRVFYSEGSDNMCLIVEDVVNVNYENPTTELEDACISIISASSVNNPYGARLFPNPASDFTQLQLARVLPSDVSIRVVDLAGRMVTTIPNTAQTSLTVNTAQFAPGVYYLVLEGEYSQTLRFIVQE